MKMKAKSRKGLTVVECAAALAISAIVFLAISTIVAGGHKSWNETWKRVNLQKDASYAMLVMGRPIKKAVSAVADANSKAITITDSAGATVKFSSSGGHDALRCKVGQGSPFDIIGDVNYINFVVDDANDTVTINLELKNDDVQTYFISTVMMRNAGG